MIYSYEINGLPLQTGDLICTTDGGRPIIAGEFWRLLGKLVPGEVDHVAIYVGPKGRCVESAVVGVHAFEVPGPTWDAGAMYKQRLFLDQLYGIACPFNINYLDSQTEDAFYCGQLAYKAYLRQGIDLNTGLSVPNLEGTESIIFPQEMWAGCFHRRPQGA